MGILSVILGAATLVGSLVTAAVSAKRAKETDEYNQHLNQTLIDREDNSWQRAVEDRSKSGLSIAGLSQGAGSGGTVSQLQSQQSTAFQSLSNVLQNGSGIMFGLANSAYDRKLQKQISTDELELKKQQLKHEKLISRLQYIMDVAQLRLAANKASDEHKIFEHNYAIAQGKQNNPLARVYGSEPSDIERLLTGLYNNRETIKNNINEKLEETKEQAKDFVSQNITGTKGSNAFSTVPIRKLVGDFTAEKIPDGYEYLNIQKSVNGKDFILGVKNNKTQDIKHIDISKAQFEKIQNWLKENKGKF